jgi:uncharacterized protein YcgI (DUF1989 family)
MASGIGNGIGIYPPARSAADEKDAEFIVNTTAEGTVVIKGARFSIDGQLLVIVDRHGKQIAAFNYWNGVRVKEEA